MNIVCVTSVTQPSLVAAAAAVTTVAVQGVDTVAVRTRIRSTLVDICAKIKSIFDYKTTIFFGLSLSHLIDVLTLIAICAFKSVAAQTPVRTVFSIAFAVCTE